MKKNTATKWIVFAWTTATGLGKTGDAANITANVRIDGGAANPVDDTNPTELEDGYYVFDITAAECNGDNILICPQSSTSGVQVIGVPGAVWTKNDLSTADILAMVVEGTVTFVQAVRLVLAVLTGKSSGGGTTFRDIGDTKNRLVATVDGSNNRTAISTRDGS